MCEYFRLTARAHPTAHKCMSTSTAAGVCQPRPGSPECSYCSRPCALLGVCQPPYSQVSVNLTTPYNLSIAGPNTWRCFRCEQVWSGLLSVILRSSLGCDGPMFHTGSSSGCSSSGLVHTGSSSASSDLARLGGDSPRESSVHAFDTRPSVRHPTRGAYPCPHVVCP